MRNGTKSMAITTAIAAMVATVGVVGGGAANIGAAEQWESEIVGLAEGEPFRIVPDGEIVTVEIGSGFLPEYVGLIADDGTELRTQEPSPTGWPVFRWDLAPGERIVEVFGDLDPVFGIASLGVRTSHNRVLTSFGASDIVDGGPPDFELFAPDGHAVVGLTGRSYGADEFGYPTGHLAALGIITEPMATDAACEFTVTNGSERRVEVGVALNYADFDVVVFGELAPGATGTYTMPAVFIPQAPYWNLFTTEYTAVDGPAEWTFWDPGLEPCGSVLTFDPDEIVFPPPPDVTNPYAPAGLDALVEQYDNGEGGIDSLVFLTWEAAVDDVGAVEYDVLRNGVLVATTSALGAFDELVGGSSAWYQVVARDAAGNESVRTAPLRVDAVPADEERPSVPRNLSGTVDSDGAVSLVWDASTDNIGVVDYRVLRNGQEIGVSPTPSFVADSLAPGTHWIQLIARDAAGNQSYKTPPVRFDNEPPSVPQDFAVVVEPNRDVTLTWTASTDNIVGIGFDPTYRVLRNGVVVSAAAGAGYRDVAPPEGSYWYQVVAVDAAGNESRRTAPVRVDVGPPDVQRPTAPQNLTATVDTTGDVTLRWDEATDDVGVDFYVMYRNGQPAGAAGGSTAGTVLFSGAGTFWFQVAAVDAAGNQSAKTPPLRVDIALFDELPPTAPQILWAVIEANGDVTLTWDAAIDNVGVTEYQVLRNGVEIGLTPTPEFVVPAPAVGSHWYQVRARDAAGNEGNKTAPVRVDIG